MLIIHNFNAGTHGLTGQALRAATADGRRTAVLIAAAGMALTGLVALTFTRTPKNTATVADGRPTLV